MKTFLIVAITALTLQIFSISHAQTVEESSLTKSQENAILKTFKDKLKDYTSAQYKLPAMIEKEDDSLYCGFINSKNSYGGYSGYIPFVGMLPKFGDKHFFFLIRVGTDKYTEKAILQMCKEYGYGSG